MPLIGIFGVFELIFIGVFFLLMVVGASFDRRGTEHPKWYIFGIGFAIILAYYWPDFTFSGAWTTIQSWSFWEPVAAYLAAGLVYSILEFVLEVRRTARKYKGSWEQYLKSQIGVKQFDANGKPRTEMVPNRHRGGDLEAQQITKVMTVREALNDRAEPSNKPAAEEAVDSFIASNRLRHGFVSLTKSSVNGAPEPEIDRLELAGSIGAWTFFWPAYAVSLVIGDLLTEVFNAIADVLVKMSGRFVRFSFADVFKI